MSHIYLIGARGSGKTTTGRLLAQMLNRPFRDLDHCLAASAGKTIAEIVAAGGWPEFRRLEAEILQAVSAQCANQVIATGGGIILAGANRACMARHGSIVWLKVPAAVLVARLAACPQAAQRPALTDKDPATEIAQVLLEREPLYAACAHATIAAEGTPRDVCAAIFSALKLS